jgi:hypothetical protein
MSVPYPQVKPMARYSTTTGTTTATVTDNVIAARRT